MTIRLLSAFDGCPPNSIITLDAANEAGMVAAKTASLDLTGGTPFVPKVGPLEVITGPFSVRARRARNIALSDGKVLKITGAAGAVGEVTRAGSADKWIVGAGTSLTLGPYSGAQQFPITCTAGSIDAVVGDAVLAAAIVPPQAAIGGVNTRGMVNSVGAPIITIRPVTNAQPNGAYDTSTFREIFQVPVKGKCLVRAVFETTTNTATVIDSVALSAGRNYSNDDPVKADGTPGDWSVFTAIDVSAAADAANGLFGTGRTPWALLDIPAPTDGGLGGYVYTGVKLAGGTRLGMVGNGVNRSIAEYEGYISAKVPALKFRALRRASLDFVNSNQNAMGASGPSYLSEYCPVTHLEIAPVTRVISIAHFGDSTGDGLGTGTPLVQPNHYNWAMIGANALIQEQGMVIAVSNFCHEGKKTLYNIQNRLGTLLADPEFCPSAVIIQPFSINDGATVGALTKAIVDASITMAMQQAMAARKRGIIPIFRTVIPSVSLNATTDAFRKAGNDAIRASGEVVIDLDALVSDTATPARLLPGYSLDGTHMSAMGNEAGAPAFTNAARRIFFE